MLCIVRDSDLIANYFNSRNGMIGGDYSTKFAPWLAHGCLSPRTIYHEIAKYEAQRPQNKNKSTYWVSLISSHQSIGPWRYWEENRLNRPNLSRTLPTYNVLHSGHLRAHLA